jgi:hypothetical protein
MIVFSVVVFCMAEVEFNGGILVISCECEMFLRASSDFHPLACGHNKLQALTGNISKGGESDCDSKCPTK